MLKYQSWHTQYGYSMSVCFFTTGTDYSLNACFFPTATQRIMVTHNGPPQLPQCRLAWSNKLPERLRIHMVYLLTAKCGVMRRTKCAPQLLLAEIGNCHLSCAPGFQNQMHQGQHHNHCRAAVILAAGATTGVGARTETCIYIYIYILSREQIFTYRYLCQDFSLLC